MGMRKRCHGDAFCPLNNSEKHQNLTRRYGMASDWIGVLKATRSFLGALRAVFDSEVAR